MTKLPLIAKRRLAWFLRYVQWYLGRNFHAVHLLRLCDLESLQACPLLVCSNHPSWWDPLVCGYISQRFFPDREHYAPIDSSAVQKYKFFLRLGFFPVQSGTAGAGAFLRIGRAVLNNRNAALWVTPQARFTDPRVRPVEFAPGVGHLPRHAKQFAMLPVALEYAFWNERFAEAFACIGEPVFIDGECRSPSAWSGIFADALLRTQEFLSARVIERNQAAFEPLIEGRAGVGGVYDWWRAAKSRLHGKRFEAEHGGI